MTVLGKLSMGGGSAYLTNITATFSTKAVGALIGLASSILAARALGPEGRGLFATAATLALIGMQFANVGLHSSNTYFLAQDKTRLPNLIGNSVAASAILGSLAAGLIAAVAWAFGLAADLPHRLLGIALAIIPIGVAYMLLSNLLLGLSEFTRFNAIEVGYRLVALALVAAAFAVGSQDAATYLFTGLIAQALAVVAVWMSLGQPLSSMRTASVDLMRKQAPFAFRTYLNNLLGFILLRIDILMVQWFSGNAETGHYSIAVAMVDVIYMLATAAAQVMFPRLIAISAASERKAATLRVLVEIGVGMAVFGLAASLVAAPAVNFFFGQSFLPAVPMFHILVPAILIYGMNTIVSNHLAAEGMPWHAVWVWAIGLFVNFALNLLLIPEYGGRGAACASLIGYSVVFAIQVWFVFGPKGRTA